MPSYYAHEVFGEEVMEKLPSDCTKLLTQGIDGWRLGLFGPDPLMLHPKTNRFARDLHRLTTADAIERLSRSFQKGDNTAAAFAAGLLCHHALDSACHPNVLSMADGKYDHAAIEAQFDRYLMCDRGLIKGKRADIVVPKSADVFVSAAAAWPGISPALYKHSFALFKKSMDFLTRTAGSPVSRAYNVVTGNIKPLRHIYGVLAPLIPSEKLMPACQRLERVMTDSVEGTAILITSVLRLFMTADVFRVLPNTDFYGARVCNA